jgi:hypothetical protein
MLAVTTALGFLCIPPASFAQGRVDIIQIYENFLASRVAALDCVAVDNATEPKFLSNQRAVTIRAMQALKERNRIAQNGCSSERIKALLKLYKLRSEMALGG